ncbi:ATP-binding protein [Streptomyces sp. NPDC001941]|uniref:ATP-binding protein n=1 Tax=Streptomyces sp. NPDC001941 TaxID=3154659 RepID=UPI00331EB2EE
MELRQLRGRLEAVLEASAVLCVSGLDAAPSHHRRQAAALVQWMLEELHQQAAVVRLAPPAQGGRTAVADALWQALVPDQSRRPRLLADAEHHLDRLLARRSQTILLVEEADRLRSEGLLWLYARWRTVVEAGGAAVLVLTGGQPLVKVLRRPLLASLRSSVYVHHHLSTRESGLSAAPTVPAQGVGGPGQGAGPEALGQGAGLEGMFVRPEIASVTHHPDGKQSVEWAPAIWTLAHRGYSGGGRLNVWAHPDEGSALKAGARLAMESGLDEDPDARRLYAAGAFEQVLQRYEDTHPDTHLLRVQAAFLEHDTL